MRMRNEMKINKSTVFNFNTTSLIYKSDIWEMLGDFNVQPQVEVLGFSIELLKKVRTGELCYRRLSLMRVFLL